MLEIATRGGAAVLGRDDIGSLEPGKCADFFGINLDRVEYAGALHDPVAATVFCAPQKADYTVIDGRVIVEGGPAHDARPGAGDRGTQSLFVVDCLTKSAFYSSLNGLSIAPIMFESRVIVCPFLEHA